MFIIDSSRSVRPHEFETMRKFMIDIIHTLDMEANATRVGVVQYSSQVNNLLSTSQFILLFIHISEELRLEREDHS